MDRLDAGIIREFSGPHGSYQWNVRESYSKIAKKLGADEETVRRRIRAMESLGFVRGSELVVNPYVLGLSPARIFVNVPDPERRKQEIISKLKLVDGILLMFDMHGEGIQILLFCEKEKISRRIELISAIAECKAPVVFKDWQALGFKRPRVEITSTDTKILNALRKNPRKSIQQVGKETGVSVRTVQRRITLLTENFIFFHMFRLDFKRIDAVACSLLVNYNDQMKKRDIDDVILSKLDRIFYSATSLTHTSLFNFFCRNISEGEVIKTWVSGIDGVAETRMGIINEYILVTEWLDEEIANLAQSGKRTELVF
ncbi:MAG: AsnC family transcriptional regulator [Thaumarchaeota archaeon]|nr:AsnC family transcriptional regulator [Nitrososphaerota archaeon]